MATPWSNPRRREAIEKNTNEIPEDLKTFPETEKAEEPVVEETVEEITFEPTTEDINKETTEEPSDAVQEEKVTD